MCNGVCLRHATESHCGAYAISRVHMHAVYLIHRRQILAIQSGQGQPHGCHLVY